MAFENITLEKGMYGVPGKNFTQVLEELDGSQNYAGTVLFRKSRLGYHPSGKRSGFDSGHRKWRCG